jgi:hypothetical protein
MAIDFAALDTDLADLRSRPDLVDPSGYLKESYRDVFLARAGTTGTGSGGGTPGGALEATQLLIKTAVETIVAARTTAFLGGVGVVDRPFTTALRSVTCSNNTATVVYLQFHSKATALALNDVPLNGLIFIISSGQTLFLDTSYFGNSGKLFTNGRIGLSSTFGTYTANPTANTSLALEVA